MLEKTCQPVHHFFVLEKQQTIKKEEKKKKRKTKISRKQKIWFMVYKLPKSNTSEKRQKFIGVGLLVEQIIQ